MRTSRRVRAGTLTASCVGAVLLLSVLTACGGSATVAKPRLPGAGANAVGRPNATLVTGKILSTSSSALQIQTVTGAAQITYSSATSIRAVEAASVAAISSGDCVRVIPQPSAGAPVRARTSLTKPVSAASILLTDCGQPHPGQFGGTLPTAEPGPGGSSSPFGGTGAPPAAVGSAFPIVSSSGVPGVPGGVRRPWSRGVPGGFGVIGRVESVKGDHLRVVTTLGAPVALAGAGGSATATVTVTVTSATQVRRAVTATLSSADVGQCATAAGTSRPGGALAATTIELAQPVDGICSLNAVTTYGGGM